MVAPATIGWEESGMGLARAVGALGLIAFMAGSAFADPQVYSINAPASVTAGQTVTITWTTNGPDPIKETRVWWGTSSGNESSATKSLAATKAGATQWTATFTAPSTAGTL